MKSISANNRSMIVSSWSITSALVFVLLGCGSNATMKNQSTSNIKSAEASSPVKSNLPELDLGTAAAAENILSLTGCYKIEYIKHFPSAKQGVWVPDELSTRVCATGHTTPGENSSFGWTYYGDGSLFTGVAGGPVGKVQSCKDCLTAYHGWFFETFKMKKVRSGYTLDFYVNTYDQTTRKVSYDHYASVKLTKISMVPIADLTPTLEQIKLIKTAFQSCFKPTKSDTLGNWKDSQDEKVFYEKTKSICFDVKDIKVNNKDSVLVTVEITSEDGTKKAIPLPEIETHAKTTYGYPMTEYITVSAPSYNHFSVTQEVNGTWKKLNGTVNSANSDSAFVSYDGERE